MRYTRTPHQPFSEDLLLHQKHFDRHKSTTCSWLSLFPSVILHWDLSTKSLRIRHCFDWGLFSLKKVSFCVKITSLNMSRRQCCRYNCLSVFSATFHHPRIPSVDSMHYFWCYFHRFSFAKARWSTCGSGSWSSQRVLGLPRGLKLVTHSWNTLTE